MEKKISSSFHSSSFLSLPASQNIMQSAAANLHVKMSICLPFSLDDDDGDFQETVFTPHETLKALLQNPHSFSPERRKRGGLQSAERGVAASMQS